MPKKPAKATATEYTHRAHEFATGKAKAEAAMLLGKPFKCLACGGDRFYTRKTMLNTAGLTFLDLDWANREATNLLCERCGHIHWFAT